MSKDKSASQNLMEDRTKEEESREKVTLLPEGVKTRNVEAYRVSQKKYGLSPFLSF